ncbi:MAG: hypothetical protein BWY80_00745 [Firmicutes bacterium ADurb.Bin456]|nr:MAG: hypothetical protein BWY80_00745 [Firmicutes bacterium ADurb.Bin456]
MGAGYPAAQKRNPPRQWQAVRCGCGCPDAKSKEPALRQVNSSNKKYSQRNLPASRSHHLRLDSSNVPVIRGKYREGLYLRQSISRRLTPGNPCIFQARTARKCCGEPTRPRKNSGCAAEAGPSLYSGHVHLNRRHRFWGYFCAGIRGGTWPAVFYDKP